MTNPHILLVKKWLADPELLSSKDKLVLVVRASKEHSEIKTKESELALYAAIACNCGQHYSATYIVKRYEELTNE